MKNSTRTYGSKSGGFTLIELLLVIGILALLSALIFPAFARARKQASNAACLSNLGQIARGIATYMTDYDGLFPHAVDASDKLTPEIWSQYPEFMARIPSMPAFHEVTQAYMKSPEAFKSPLDTGMLVLESHFPKEFKAKPSLYSVFGSSYFFRTEIAFKFFTVDGFELPGNTNVIFSGSGHWSSDARELRPDDSYSTYWQLVQRYRYNVLYGDWRVKNISHDEFEKAWATPL